MKAEMASQDAALSSQAERLKVLKAAERYEEYNALVRRYNAAITVRREINGRFNQTVRSYNALPKFTERIVHIGGGISVRPDAFTVRNAPSSPAVARIEDLTAKASPGEGVTAHYDKIHPVPFAEYMPSRDFFYALAPDLVGLVTRDYSPGTRSNVVMIDETPVGLSICFDITDDQQAYDMQRDDGQVVFAQTNNADFGRTDESLQQLSIARLRAMEMGVFVIASNRSGEETCGGKTHDFFGRSCVIAPTGEVLAEAALVILEVDRRVVVTSLILNAEGVQQLVILDHMDG
jgi:predicted amidohydrolase